MEENTNIQLVKAVARLIVGVSTSFTVANALRNNVTPTSKLQEAEVAVAAFAIGGATSEVTKQYTDKTIDSVYDLYKKFTSTEDTDK